MLSKKVKFILVLVVLGTDPVPNLFSNQGFNRQTVRIHNFSFSGFSSEEGKKRSDFNFFVHVNHAIITMQIWTGTRGTGTCGWTAGR